MRYMIPAVITATALTSLGALTNGAKAADLYPTPEPVPPAAEAPPPAAVAPPPVAVQAPAVVLRTGDHGPGSTVARQPSTQCSFALGSLAAARTAAARRRE